MTSHTPPRLSSNSSHQPWRQFDEKSTFLSSFSSTLKMDSTRGWLASTSRDTLPMHHHQKHRNDTTEWKGSPQQHHNFLSHLRRAIRNVLRPSDTSPSISRRSGGFSIGRTSVSSPRLPALPSFSTMRFMLLCGLWYASSALSSNTSKAILNQFRYPVTLTLVQFAFVAAYCLLFMSPVIRFSRMRRPTRAIFKDTLPMGCFQVGGHIFSSMAISRIPVSTTHTIKVRALIRRWLAIIFMHQFLGALTSLHGCCICPSIRGAVFSQDVHISTTPYAWGHASMLIRRVRVQRCRSIVRVRFSHRLRVIEYILQEDHAYRFFGFFA